MSIKITAICDCCKSEKEIYNNDGHADVPIGWFKVSLIKNKGSHLSSDTWYLSCCPECVNVSEEKSGNLKSFFKKLRL